MPTDYLIYLQKPVDTRLKCGDQASLDLVVIITAMILGHEGDAPLVGFSPRKAKISLYITTEDSEREKLLALLGKHTSGKACVYVNKLADVDEDIIKQLIKQSIQFLQERYPIDR